MTSHKRLKVVLIGDVITGKTSILQRYCDNTFSPHCKVTIGVELELKRITVDGESMQLMFWDMSGSPLFQNLRMHYYENSDGIVLVYSVIDRRSFENTSKWLSEVHDALSRYPPILIVGNKIDLRDKCPKTEQVTTEEGIIFTKSLMEMGVQCAFVETSASTAQNIDHAFSELVRMILKSDISKNR